MDRLEELILIKCPYYLNQSKDSMQSLSRFEGHFLKRRKTTPKVSTEVQKTPYSQSNFVCVCVGGGEQWAGGGANKAGGITFSDFKLQ